MTTKNSDIRRAVEFMINAHSGQFRKFSGEEYAWHPVGVAKIVRNLKSSKNKDKICIAALLHVTRHSGSALDFDSDALRKNWNHWVEFGAELEPREFLLEMKRW